MMLMTQATPGNTNSSPPRSHPDVAVVVIARREAEPLASAVQAAAALRGFGIEVLALLLVPTGRVFDPGSGGLNLRRIAVDPNADETVWRAQALGETAADVVEFVDDQAAALMPWEDVAPVRLGIVQPAIGTRPALRASLERLAVPEPDQLSAGTV